MKVGKCIDVETWEKKGTIEFLYTSLALGESNLMGPKKSVEVKFFTEAFFGGCRASSMMTPGTI